MTYTTELELAVTVEVVAAERGHHGGRWHAPEPDSVELRVRLGELEITQALPADVLAALEDDARDRLFDADAERLL